MSVIVAVSHPTETYYPKENSGEALCQCLFTRLTAKTKKSPVGHIADATLLPDDKKTHLRKNIVIEMGSWILIRFKGIMDRGRSDFPEGGRESDFRLTSQMKITDYTVTLQLPDFPTHNAHSLAEDG